MSALQALINDSRREREDWRYTDIEKLLETAPSQPAVSRVLELPAIAADSKSRQRLVFVNGVWDKKKSQFGDLMPTILHSDAENGYRLSLAAKSCMVTAPIELVFVGEGKRESNLKLAIEVGANASLSLVEHHIGTGIAAHLVETEITLGKQAKIIHEKIVHNLSGTTRFSRSHVQVKEGAYYRHFALLKDARLLREEINVNLAGALAQCGLYGAMLLGGHEHVDVLTRVNHQAPHTSSQQLYKAIVKDQARGVFQGRIHVAKGAQKTDGRQLCRALLLSDQAEMDAKPELEIYADDVSCSHGCAVGDLDVEAMFYLRSRGLDENEARALLLRAFIDEAIDMIQAEDARVYVRNLAERWMHEQD